MKRVIYLVVLMVALLAPFSVGFDGQTLKLKADTAHAACASPEPTGLICCNGADVSPASDASGNSICPSDPLAGVSKACPPITVNGKTVQRVETALPILSGGDKCITNDVAQGGAIVTYLIQILKLLNIAVGLVILLMIVLSGVQYITSVGDSGAVKSAKTRLQNAIVALLLYLSMFAILSFLIPGGIT